MVRFATAQLRAGHLPLTSWFPYLGLGSPQFLHYQSLPAMLDRRRRPAGRAGHRVPLVAVPAAVAVAGQRLPVGPRVRRGQAGGGRLGRDGPVPDERHRGRLRAARLRLDRLRRVDAAVGVVDAAARVGLQLARDPRRARLPPAVLLDRAHRRAALRDRLPGALGAARLAARRRQAARGPVAAGRGPPRRFAARVGVGDRPAAASSARGRPSTSRSRAPGSSTATARGRCWTGWSRASCSTTAGCRS